jgi:predicted metal-dependent hydrolase
MSNLHTIEYGTKPIAFELEFKDRKTLAIRVEPNCTVRVYAPLLADVSNIRQKVEGKAAWILKQQDYFKAFTPKTPTRQFVSGETHLYLGRQYRLKIEPILDAATEGVRLSLGYITIKTHSRNKEHLQALLNSWYQSKAEIHFRAILRDVLTLFHRYKIIEPTVHIRFMEKRWGSCSSKGKILLNTELIKASKSCIRYVVIHELCHLIEPNHAKAFYHLLAKILPDYAVWKEKLEKMLV